MFLLVRIVSKVKKYFPIKVKKVLNTEYVQLIDFWPLHYSVTEHVPK